MSIDLDKKEEDYRINIVVNDNTFIQPLIDRLDDQEFYNKNQYDIVKFIVLSLEHLKKTKI